MIGKLIILYLFVLCHGKMETIKANSEERLISNLLESYNKEIRPIRNSSQIIQVNFIMTLQQMISVIEKVLYTVSTLC